MSNSRKKAILRRWNQEWLPGYLPPSGFLFPSADEFTIQLLDLAGKVQSLPIAQLKWICFVRDFNSGEMENPERLLRKTFAGRPRTAGLWIRLRLKDDDVLEGLAANEASLVTSSGVFLSPPDTRSNTQRIFVPAASIFTLEVLGLVGAPSRNTIRPRSDRMTLLEETQPDLFPKS